MPFNSDVAQGYINKRPPFFFGAVFFFVRWEQQAEKMADTSAPEWDWTSVYKTDLVKETEEEDSRAEPESKPPVSAACSHDHSAERAIYGNTCNIAGVLL